MRGTEAIVFATNAAAGTYGMPTGAGNSQGLQGGLYVPTIACTGAPSCQLQIQDQSGNWIDVGAPITSAGGGSLDLYCPPGQAQVVVSGSSANTVTLARVPIE